ncbi:hypothetical protein MP638_005710 [Amoeboaphelidium occidentale]|nr:hypothetical protein MP638_005710 [Amoeboaphelidium occidentale]
MDKSSKLSLTDILSRAKAASQRGPSSTGPVFVPKEKRAVQLDHQLGAEKKDSSGFKQRMDIVSNNEHKNETVEPLPKRQRTDLKSTKKFVFGWNNEEDTSTAQHLPIVRRTTEIKDSLGYSYKSKKNPYEDLHWSEKPLQYLTNRDWRIFREDYNISLRGSNVAPIRSWLEAPLPVDLKDVVMNIGYDEPTPIQRQAIPVVLEKKDLIGIAETGSGKTAAFLIPIVTFLLNNTNRSDRIHDDDHGPSALVLVPTRELAQQIENESSKFCRPFGFRCFSIVGGKSYEDQLLQSRAGIDILIATPGRLLDCLERRIVILSDCSLVVLDEADRMVDLGFESSLTSILDSMSSQKERHTIMFSATMPVEVERIAKTYMRSPVVVTVGSAGQVVETVSQVVEMVQEDAKKARLLATLERELVPPVIVFVNQKANVDMLGSILEREGYRVVTIHGGKTQDAREASLQLLRSGKKEILVATDVAGRGIDIPDVSMVINYDMPKRISDYVHRIGRTGRAGKSGVALTFLTLEDSEIFFDLRQLLMKSNAKIPAALAKHEASQAKAGTGVQKRRQDQIIHKD